MDLGTVLPHPQVGLCLLHIWPKTSWIGGSQGPASEVVLSGPTTQSSALQFKPLTLPHQLWSHTSAPAVESLGLFSVNFLQPLRGWASGPVKSQSGRQPWLPARPRRLYLEQDNSQQTHTGPTLQRSPNRWYQVSKQCGCCSRFHLFVHSFIHLFTRLSIPQIFIDHPRA